MNIQTAGLATNPITEVIIPSGQLAEVSERESLIVEICNADNLELLKSTLETVESIITFRTQNTNKTILNLAIESEAIRILNHLITLLRTVSNPIDFINNETKDNIIALNQICQAGLKCKPQSSKLSNRERARISKELINLGSNVSFKDSITGSYPIICCVNLKDTELLRSLKLAGADVDSIDKNSSTALLVACMNGDVEMVRALFLEFPIPDCSIHANVRAFNFAFFCSRSLGCVKCIMESGSHWKEYITGKGLRPFKQTIPFNAIHSTPEIVKYLAKQGVDFNHVDENNNTPFQLCVQKYKYAVANAILPHLSKDIQEHSRKEIEELDSVNRSDGITDYLFNMFKNSGLDLWGNLLLAIRTEDSELFMAELKNLRSPEILKITDKQGRSLLHYSSIYKFQFGSGILMHRGLSITAKDIYSATPLHYALSWNNQEFNNLAPGSAASYDFINSYIDMCINGVEAMGFWENESETPHQGRVQQVRDALETINNHGLSCLHLAATIQHTEILEKLCKQTNQVDITSDAFGGTAKTPLIIAVENGNVEASKVFVKKGADIWHSQYIASLESPPPTLSPIATAFIEVAQCSIRLNQKKQQIFRLEAREDTEEIEILQLSIEITHLEIEYSNRTELLNFLIFTDKDPSNQAKPKATVAHELLLMLGTEPTDEKIDEVNRALELLVEKGYEIDAIDSISSQAEGYDPRTPLHMACAAGLTRVADCLLRLGVSLESKTGNYGLTPALCAGMRGHIQTLKFLFAKGAGQEAIANDGSSLLHYFIKNMEAEKNSNKISIDDLKVFSDDAIKSLVNRKDKSQPPRSPFYIAVLTRNHELVEALIEKGADLGHLNTRNNFFVQLISTVDQEKEEWTLDRESGKMRALLCQHIKKKKDKKHLHSPDGKTPSNIKESFNDPNLQKLWQYTQQTFQKSIDENNMKRILDKIDNIRETSSQGNTIFHSAAERQSVEIMQAIIRRMPGKDVKCMVNSRNDLGFTPLHLAVKDGNVNKDLVSILLANNADPYQANDVGFLPDYYLSQEQNTIYQKLIKDIQENKTHKAQGAIPKKRPSQREKGLVLPITKSTTKDAHQEGLMANNGKLGQLGDLPVTEPGSSEKIHNRTGSGNVAQAPRRNRRKNRKSRVQPIKEENPPGILPVSTLKKMGYQDKAFDSGCSAEKDGRSDRFSLIEVSQNAEQSINSSDKKYVASQEGVIRQEEVQKALSKPQQAGGNSKAKKKNRKKNKNSGHSSADRAPAARRIASCMGDQRLVGPGLDPGSRKSETVRKFFAKVQALAVQNNPHFPDKPSDSAPGKEKSKEKLIKPDKSDTPPVTAVAEVIDNHGTSNSLPFDRPIERDINPTIPPGGGWRLPIVDQIQGDKRFDAAIELDMYQSINFNPDKKEGINCLDGRFPLSVREFCRIHFTHQANDGVIPHSRIEDETKNAMLNIESRLIERNLIMGYASDLDEPDNVVLNTLLHTITQFRIMYANTRHFCSYIRNLVANDLGYSFKYMTFFSKDSQYHKSAKLIIPDGEILSKWARSLEEPVIINVYNLSPDMSDIKFACAVSNASNDEFKYSMAPLIRKHVPIVSILFFGRFIPLFEWRY